MGRARKADAAAAPVNGDEEFEFSGSITDYWSYTQCRDYVMLMPGMNHTAFRLYMILRSMVIEASRRPRGGMRRMTIDQLCWLLPGPNDKDLSVSAMYDLLKLLEKLNLVVPKDVLELDGITQLKGKERAAKGIARGFTVNDLPPEAAYTGWRNAWDKLDAYTPDWRMNRPKPPTHLTEIATEPNGVIRARVKLLDGAGKPFQKTGTPQVTGAEESSFQNSGTAFQDSGTADQDSGTDLALTSENDHPLRSSLEEASLSPAAGAPSDTVDSAEDGVEERENPATPTKTTPAQSAADGAEPVPAAAAVAAQFADLWKAERGTRPSRRQLDGIAVDAAEAIAAEDAVEWLTDSVVPFMVGRGYFDLARAKTHPHCPAPRGTKVPGQRPAVPEWCGECNDGSAPDLVAERFRRQGGRLVKCPECHPGGVRQPAAV
ncbi:hypothetical protein ABZ957_15455 [Streptomyces sp. NPDC046316]|uniref:hypothetical protein n=1 Tax=Streptomyces sp. NPDC046316 TaxID=3154494 RepID=UPI0033F01069